MGDIDFTGKLYDGRPPDYEKGQEDRLGIPPMSDLATWTSPAIIIHSDD